MPYHHFSLVRETVNPNRVGTCTLCTLLFSDYKYKEERVQGVYPFTPDLAPFLPLTHALPHAHTEEPT